MVEIEARKTLALADKLAKRDFEKTLNSVADILSFLSEKLNAFASSSEGIFDLEMAQQRIDSAVGTVGGVRRELAQLKVRLGDASTAISEMKAISGVGI